MTTTEKCEAILKYLLDEARKQGAVVIRPNLSFQFDGAKWPDVVDRLYQRVNGDDGAE